MNDKCPSSMIEMFLANARDEPDRVVGELVPGAGRAMLAKANDRRRTPKEYLSLLRHAASLLRRASARRCFSVMPPQIPNRSRVSRA